MGGLIEEHLDYLDDLLAITEIPQLWNGLAWTPHPESSPHRSKPSARAKTAPHPVGVHVRHILDFYSCLLVGIDSRIVDYDNRARDARIERSPAYAAARIVSVKSELRDRAKRAFDHEIEVLLRERRPHQGAPLRGRSTLSREFLFLRSHTIHHLAMIRLFATGCQIELHDDFGVDPSTLAYRETECRLARRP